MSKVPFNVNAYTAHLIGRENVSKLEGALLELVKNTYDADASVCILYYEDSTKMFYIADNGNGMSEEIIMKHWMTIGNSSKVINYKTKKGRIQNGAKGIGRFALDRISDKCKMLTINEGTNLEWNVDWSDFDSNTTITDIYADLSQVDFSMNDFFSKIKNEFLKNFIAKNFLSAGTAFKLSSLRDEWSASLVESIKKNLATLIPPEIEEIYKIYFFCEDTNTEDARVKMDDGQFSFDYKIEFSSELDGNVVTQIYRNEFDFQDQFEKVMRETEFTEEDRDYFKGSPIVTINNFADLLPNKNIQVSNTIGKFSGTLYYSKLSAEKPDKEKYFYRDFIGRRDFRDIFGGIKIYRDNFRVRPYGEPKTSSYDWLLLSNRKNKSPSAISSLTGNWKVNADQILGSIFISRTNITLPDQANREGIVETKEFVQLRDIIKALIQLFEKDRQYVGRILNKYYDDTHPTEQIEMEILSKYKKEERTGDTNKGKQSASQSKPELIEVAKVKTVIDSKDNIIKDLEDENRLLRTLATTGIITNTYIHEIKDSTHKLSMKIIMAKEALELDDNKEEALFYINAANRIKESFNSWFKVTIESVRRDKRTMKVVELQQLLRGLVASWNETVGNKGITVLLEIDEIHFKCFPYEIESLLNNLIVNSITSLENMATEQKRILLRIYKTEFGILIKYEDNGSGLGMPYKKNPKRILEAFETDKRNDKGEPIGTGMGMWIVAKTINEYNGTIDLSENISKETGFYINIVLNSKKI